MSVIDMLAPLYRVLPEVRSPERKPEIKTRFFWTLGVLVLYFLMGRVLLVGMDVEKSAGGFISQFEFILASETGSLITAGIGPVVLASIILQLLVGTKIISIDLSVPEQKAKFTSLQKLLAITLSVFEAFVYTSSGLIVATTGMFPFVVLQIALGSILLLYLDEVVSKYGIGSGISLFIAGGVALDIVWTAFTPFSEVGVEGAGAGGPQGMVFQAFRNLIPFNAPGFLVNFLPIIFTVVVFLLAVWAEGIHVNVPITVGKYGMMSRYPIKFLYVSNIPVILAVALFANIRLWSLMTQNIPVLGAFFTKISDIVNNPGNLITTIVLQGIPPDTLQRMLHALVTLTFDGSVGATIVHSLLYILILTICCVVFGKLWTEMGGQGAQDVANQLNKAGMHIPGFRRDPRIVEKILLRYIPPITILGSAFVGMLAGLADLSGSLSRGTGILLAVGIVYRLYEELARLQVAEMHPMLKKLFAGR